MSSEKELLDVQLSTLESWKVRVGEIEEEVSGLEERLMERDVMEHCTEEGDLHLQQSLADCLSGQEGFSVKTQQSLRESQSCITDLEDQLRSNRTLRQINMIRNTSQTIEQDSVFVHRRHLLEGSCDDINFTVKYDVQEKLGGENTEACITQLKIDVEEGVHGMDHAIRQMEDAKDVQGFFLFLHSYVTQSKLRKQIFSDCKQKFGSSVDILFVGETPHLEVTKENLPQLKWFIYWEHKLTSLCRVVPLLQLDIQIPPYMRELDEYSLLKMAPAEFQTLLKERGIENALSQMIHMATS